MKKAFIFLMLISLVTNSNIAMAADNVKKLERRLMALEEQIFSMGGDKNGSSSAGSNTSISDFEVRLQQLEEEAQKVYGAIEEMAHSVEKFAKKMDMISKDLDMRIQDIENNASSSGEVASKSKKSKKTSEVAKSTAKASKSVVKSTAKIATKKAVSSKSQKKAKNNNWKVVPKEIKAETHYNKAYSYLIATSYDAAELWMKEFLTRHPKHELADNAHYWLGEVHLVKNEPEQAVVSFSTGLSKFPEGGKAAANLLKMGVAFNRLDKKDFAKSSWEKLMEDHPKTPESQKAKKALDDLL